MKHVWAAHVVESGGNRNLLQLQEQCVDMDSAGLAVVAGNAKQRQSQDTSTVDVLIKDNK